MVTNVKIAYNLRNSASSSQVGSNSSTLQDVEGNLRDSKGKLKASFLVSHSISITEAKKPFSDGEGEYIKKNNIEYVRMLRRNGQCPKNNANDECASFRIDN